MPSSGSEFTITFSEGWKELEQTKRCYEDESRKLTEPRELEQEMRKTTLEELKKRVKEMANMRWVVCPCFALVVLSLIMNYISQVSGISLSSSRHLTPSNTPSASVVIDTSQASESTPLYDTRTSTLPLKVSH